MYPPALATALRDADIEAATISELGLQGTPDGDVLDLAVRESSALLTENVGDFTRIAADRTLAGLHHPGVLIALSSRFSRRPGGRGELVAAIVAVADEPLEDRVVYLERPDRR